MIPLLLTTNYLLLTTNAGWYSAELLSLGVGSRACGMGSAYTSIADDGFCAWWNPAGVVKNKEAWVAGMHSPTYGGVSKFNFISIGYPSNKFGSSISFAGLGVDSIPEFPDTLVPVPMGFFSDMELAVLLSCAYKCWENTGIGLTLKHINYNLYNTHALGWGVDFGILHRRQNILLGLVLKDIGGTKIKWATNREDFRQMGLSFGMGFVYKNFIVSVDALYEYEFLCRVGAEYSLLDVLFLRVGFNKSITGGAGIRIRNISIDYAFTTHKLGNTHRISASFFL